MSTALPWLDAPPRPETGRRTLRRLRRRGLPRRVRVIVAALLAGVIVWIVAEIAAPAPPPHAVLTATGDLPAGHVLATGDLVAAHVEAELRPDDAIADPAQAVGRRLAVPLGHRHIVGEDSLSSTRTLGAGQRALHVPVADPGALRLLAVGDVVDLIAVDTGRPVATSVSVLAVDDPSEESAGHGLVVAVSAESLATLVPATAAGGITPALRNP